MPATIPAVTEDAVKVHTGELQVMTAADGDVKTRWSIDNAEEVAAVRAKFDELVKGATKYAAYTETVEDGQVARDLIREFDPTAARIVAFRQVQGG
jgi:hypothetical protein